MPRTLERLTIEPVSQEQLQRALHTVPFDPEYGFASFVASGIQPLSDPESMDAVSRYLTECIARRVVPCSHVTYEHGLKGFHPFVDHSEPATKELAKAIARMNLELARKHTVEVKFRSGNDYSVFREELLPHLLKNDYRVASLDLFEMAVDIEDNEPERDGGLASAGTNLVYTVPSVTASRSVQDWFDSLRR